MFGALMMLIDTLKLLQGTLFIVLCPFSKTTAIVHEAAVTDTGVTVASAAFAVARMMHKKNMLTNIEVLFTIFSP
jgi:hypothetical protein